MNDTPNPFDNTTIPNWCPGCGNYNILAALKNALYQSGLKQEEIVLAGDIGCSSKLPHYTQTYSFSGLHGRVVPLATGIKLANHKLTVIAIGGDGGIYGEGTGHFIHAARRNLNITLLVHDNKVYGLTKGQTSPTSDEGFRTSVTPDGSLERSFNPLSTALVSGATFVARGFAGEPEHLKELILAAVSHRGFSLIDIFQPCVSFNHINTQDWYNQRLYKVENEKGYKRQDFASAFRKASEWGNRIPIGLLYQETRSIYEDKLPTLQSKPLVEHFNEQVDISRLLDNMR